MANGQRFDLHKLTAACLRIPLGAWARVTDLKTHKSVKVQITDRGPFGKGRVIDLSESAARALAVPAVQAGGRDERAEKFGRQDLGIGFRLRRRSWRGL